MLASLRSERRGETFIQVHRAKKSRRCADCGAPIDPGTEYSRNTAPPWHTYSPNPGHWTHHAMCSAHPMYWPPAIRARLVA